MEISPATIDDIPQLCELLDILFTQEVELQPDYEKQAAGLHLIIEDGERGQILVLREGAALVGMVNLLFTISTALGTRVAWLEDVVVRPERRGAGAGSRLIEAAIEAARAAGCPRITLLTDGVNAGAQRFYQRHGFVMSEMVTLRRML